MRDDRKTDSILAAFLGDLRKDAMAAAVYAFSKESMRFVDDDQERLRLPRDPQRTGPEQRVVHDPQKQPDDVARDVRWQFGNVENRKRLFVTNPRRD